MKRLEIANTSPKMVTLVLCCATPTNMPPLPNTFDDETKGLIESVQRRRNDLSEFQIPRLRDCKGPLAVQQSLAAELREDIDILGRQIEVSAMGIPLNTELKRLSQALDVLVGDQKGERNRRELRRTVDEYLEALAGYVLLTVWLLIFLQLLLSLIYIV